MAVSSSLENCAGYSETDEDKLNDVEKQDLSISLSSGEVCEKSSLSRSLV